MTEKAMTAKPPHHPNHSSDGLPAGPAAPPQPRLFPVGWTLVLLAGLLTVLISHLGFMPLDTGDEARRALVSLEMILSGDYITPTLHGERYFNKPPLFNWLIVGSFTLFGTFSSFALRFPMLVSLLLFGLTIFGFVRQAASRTVALAVALMVMTSARVLLYDSMLGLIEITFAWVTYSAMMLVYHFDRKGNYWLLYLTTYALVAAGFLLKGLPAVVFQGLTLVGWFGATRRWQRLVHPAHAVGIGLFVCLCGSYYVAYFSRNSIPLADVAGVLLNESTKRTPLQFGLGDTFLHLLTFPFETLYHFAPYTLLLAILFRRDLLTILKGDPFIFFNTLTFSITVLVYWLSPQVYARYLIGLIPLLFTVLAHLYYEHTTDSTPARWWVERVWLFTAIVVAAGCWAALIYPPTRVLPGVIWKTLLVSLLLLGLAWQLSRSSPNRLGLMVAVLLVVRLGFNWLVLPGRAAKRQFYQDSAVRAARATLGHPLYSYRSTVGADNATDVSAFHIEATRRAILRKTIIKDPRAYYIADSVTLGHEPYQTVQKLVLFDRHPALLVRFVPGGKKQ